MTPDPYALFDVHNCLVEQELQAGLPFDNLMEYRRYHINHWGSSDFSILEPLISVKCLTNTQKVHIMQEQLPKQLTFPVR